MDDIFKQIIAAIISAVVPAVLGQWGLTKAQDDQKPSKGQLFTLRAVSILLGVAVFALWHWGRPSSPGPVSTAAAPTLESIQAKPNSVHKGDVVTVTVQLDRPAPQNDISVFVSSSDPAILTVDGNAVVPEGSTVGTTYSKVVKVPTYLNPVEITAVLNGTKRRAQVNITANAETPSKSMYSPPIRSPRSIDSITPAPKPEPDLKPKPAPVNAELAGRLEEAQGRLSAEKSYWEGVKQHMPAGTSLRPEITSQLFAANSTAQRCTKALEASDAASLTSCIDVLNDHLTQLSIQH